MAGPRPAGPGPEAVIAAPRPPGRAWRERYALPGDAGQGLPGASRCKNRNRLRFCAVTPAKSRPEGPGAPRRRLDAAPEHPQGTGPPLWASGRTPTVVTAAAWALARPLVPAQSPMRRRS